MERSCYSQGSDSVLLLLPGNTQKLVPEFLPLQYLCIFRKVYTSVRENTGRHLPVIESPEFALLLGNWRRA